jgi:hypothetical protein
MNIAIATIGVDPGFAVGGGSAQEAAFVGGFIVVGMILLFAAGRLCLRHGHAPHAVRYTAPRL